MRSWFKYLPLLPFFLLIANSFYCLSLIRESKDALLREKYEEIVNVVDMLTVTIDSAALRGHDDYVSTIRDATEFIDRLHQVYAAAYKLEDGQPRIITKRFFETSVFEPFDYPEFVQAVNQAPAGGQVIRYTPAGQPPRELRLYFRWLPTNAGSKGEYLVVAGVSEHSVRASLASWFTLGAWVNTMLTFLLNTILIVVLVQTRKECACA